MNEQKAFIDYLAYISETDSLSTDLEIVYSVICEQHKNLELSVFNRILIEQLKEKVKENEDILRQSISLGAAGMSYSFIYDNKRIERSLAKVIKTWKFAIIYLEEAAKVPSQQKLKLKFDELPDFLSYEEITELTGWKKKSIQTKHSNLELACIEGTGLTPKQGLFEYYKTRIKGIQENPEDWFNSTILKKGKEKKH